MSNVQSELQILARLKLSISKSLIYFIFRIWGYKVTSNAPLNYILLIFKEEYSPEQIVNFLTALNLII